MKKSFQILLSTLLLAVFFACGQYKTQYEGPYEDPAGGGGIKGNPIIYEILFVQNGQLQLASANLRYTKQLNVSGFVTQASINYAHDRIAYKTASGNISIIDSTGAAIATVPNSSGVIWFDWHPNNQTLYMLQNDQLSLYGPNVALAATNLAGALPYITDDYGIRTVAVATDGTVVFGYAIYSFSGTLNGVYIVYPSGVKRSISTSYYPPVRLRLSADGERAIVTNNVSGGFSKQTGLVYTATSGSTSFEELGDFGLAAISSPDYRIVLWDADYPDILQSYGNGLSLDITGTVTDIDW